MSASRCGCLSWMILVASPPSSRTYWASSRPGPASVCSMHHSYSSSVSPFQAKTGTPRAAIAAAAWSWVEKMLHELQRTLAPRCDQRLDQHGGLDRHVQAADDARALERLRLAEFVAQRHQARHLGLGDRDLLPPPIGESDVGDLVVGELGHAMSLLGRGVAPPLHVPGLDRGCSEWPGSKPGHDRGRMAEVKMNSIYKDIFKWSTRSCALTWWRAELSASADSQAKQRGRWNGGRGRIVGFSCSRYHPAAPSNSIMSPSSWRECVPTTR